MAEIKFCTYCGSRLSEAAAFCHVCGNAVAADIPYIPERMCRGAAPRLLSRGSVGDIYRVGSSAVKVIRYGKDETKYQNALHERDMLLQARNVRSVVPVQDWEDDRGRETLYLCMPYLQPVTEYLRDPFVGERERLRLLAELCSVLAVLRDTGIFHLDLRPKNLYVDTFGHVQLGDFSSALSAEEQSCNRIPRGTTLFMAPEVFHEGRCSERSEIYSLGLILYYWFNGNTIPFENRDTVERAVERRMAGEKLPWVFHRDAAFAEYLNLVIMKACAPAPEQRFQSFEKLRDSLERLENLCPPAVVAAPKPMYAPSMPPMPTAAPQKKKGVFGKLKDMFGAKEKAAPAPMPMPVRPGSGADDMAATLPSAFMPTRFQADEMADSIMLTPPPRRFDGDEMAYSVMLSSPPRRFDGDEMARSVALPAGAWDVQPKREPPLMSKVQFSALAPKAVQRGEYALIDLYMYEEAFRNVVTEAMEQSDVPLQEKRGSSMQVAHEAQVRVVLTSPDIPLDDCEETQTWWGDYLNFSFAAEIPEQYAKSQILFQAAVYISDVIATRLKFVVRCDGSSRQSPAVVRQDVLSAFVSYASQDRSRVAMIIQGMQKARPDLDVFFDVETLRSGEDWESALYREIDRRDVLYLCWSANARASQWVEAEWRYAMEHKGVDCIEPIPIDPPQKCPPPAELQKKHFSDRLLYIIDAGI